MSLRQIYLEGLPASGREQYRARVLFEVARALSESLGLAPRVLFDSGLARLASVSADDSPLYREPVAVFAKERAESELATSQKEEESLLALLSGDEKLAAAHRIGQAFDFLQAIEVEQERKRHGSYFTPVSVARRLIARALRQREGGSLPRTLCDPACGGGAFLLEAAAALLARRASSDGASSRYGDPRYRQEVVEHVAGVDQSSLAVEVARVALWLFVGDSESAVGSVGDIRHGDALVGKAQSDESPRYGALKGEEFARFDFPREFPAVFSEPERGFDWVVGNPPWVAFQGRATQKIPPELRAYYRENFRAFKGYPTLHGLFVERAAKLAPLGSLALLIPSSVSDLDGYRETRASLCRSHRVQEPLLEFGQDAFSGVVQPCFGLVADSDEKSELGGEAGRAWQLEERARASGEAAKVTPPESLRRLAPLPPLPPEVFREMGFQSNRVVASNLFLRASERSGAFSVPLLEGRRVGEFEEREPGLFLHPDEAILKETRCRLRPAADYESVDFVVRQTASYTIAAPHGGLRFRNSLIGGFAVPGLDLFLLLGLLNSALYRALHLSGQRDARQATFPQVKLGHLRRLPLAPDDPVARERVRVISSAGCESGGLGLSERRALDEAVFELFGFSAPEAEGIVAYLSEVAPKAIAASR